VRALAAGRKPDRLRKNEKILAFRVRLDEPSSWYNGQTYLDTLNSRAVREFIRVTHETYRRHCGREFGGIVPGIFTDEPHGGIVGDPWGQKTDATLPWTDVLPQVFRERYGYDLLPHLPELYYDVNGQGIRPARYHYHDCISHLFVTAFSKQIGEWCERNGLLFTGHVLLEDTLSDQVATTSACMRFYEHMPAPGMDLLTEQWRIYDTAKQVSSAARQFGRKWRLTETYGCTGWDFPFAGHKALGDWQVALGINLRCQHLYWYTMKGEAKRDYPASIGEQSPWWKHYAVVEDYFARLHAALVRGKEVRDLLVIHPVESMWLRVRKDWMKDPAKGWIKDPVCQQMNHQRGRLSDTLLAAHLDFDYGDEEILSRHGRIIRQNGAPVFRVGKADYKAVLVPPMLTMRRSTLRLLERFRALGGTMVFAGKPAGYLEAVRNAKPAALARRCLRTPPAGPKLAAALSPTCQRVRITDPTGKEIPGVLYLLREARDAFHLFLCNTGYTAAQVRRLPFNRDLRVRDRRAAFPSVTISGFAECAGRPEEWDPTTGERFAATARKSKAGIWQISTHLPPLASRLFVLPKKKTHESLPARPRYVTTRRVPLAPPAWNITLSEKNVFVLDKPRYRAGGKSWKPAEEILRVDRRVRKALGVPARGEGMVQPWTRKEPAVKKSIPVALEYCFNVACVPAGGLFLALESPERMAVELNGRLVSAKTDSGFWVDPSLRLISLDTATLRQGENRLILKTDYTEDDGLEIVYLLGNFGVKVQGDSAQITEPPNRLKIGDWVKQGLAFYSGAVYYRQQVVAPRVGKGERLFVRVPSYQGVAVRVLVDGKEAGLIGWEPNEVDLTDFIPRSEPQSGTEGGDSFELGLEVLGHRRNSHGPLHNKKKWPEYVGPDEFTREGEKWSDDYSLVPCGLLKNPMLEIRRPRVSGQAKPTTQGHL
jgi:hypothetical protein